MNKVAIAFSTKDRVELSKQTIEPLLRCDFDLFLVDGSTTKEGEDFLHSNGVSYFQTFANVRGGADAAIVFSLTTMLNHSNNYNFVGLCENDVLLSKGWFPPTFALFERGAAEGLEVGAVSARCFEDRILCQRDGYALCHNIGAGMVIFTRKAAELVLANFRTGNWTENRRTFMKLSGLDVGRWGAFRTNDQVITADWHFDNVLAQRGLASLALTPSPVEMIGQIPPLAEQGLKLVTEPVELLRNDAAFAAFVDRTAAIRRGELKLSCNPTQFHQADDGSWMFFPHQIADIGGKFAGDWKLKWAQGFGPFAWKANWALEENEDGINCSLTVPISGPCSFLVSGGEKGGQVQVEDLVSGYKVAPTLPPESQMTQLLNLVVPGNITYREIRLTMLTPGTIFYGISTREPQPRLPKVTFDHSKLPAT